MQGTPQINSVDRDEAFSGTVRRALIDIEQDYKFGPGSERDERLALSSWLNCRGYSLPELDEMDGETRQALLCRYDEGQRDRPAVVVGGSPLTWGKVGMILCVVVGLWLLMCAAVEVAAGISRAEAF